MSGREPEAQRRRGRFLLLHGQALLAAGDAVAAKEVLDTGFDVDDLGEGETVLSDTWHAVTERLAAGEGRITDEVRARARATYPLPHRYDFRMLPPDE